MKPKHHERKDTIKLAWASNPHVVHLSRPCLLRCRKQTHDVHIQECLPSNPVCLSIDLGRLPLPSSLRAQITNQALATALIMIKPPAYSLSTWQVAEQPSPLTEFPSSHSWATIGWGSVFG